MIRKTESSFNHLLRTVMQSVLCGVGLIGGITIGAVIIYVSGLLNELDRVVGTPLQSLTILDLIMAIAPFAIIIECGLLGTRCGMALAANIEP